MKFDSIPTNLFDTFAYLIYLIPENIQQEMKSGSEDDMCKYHHGLGRHLRNGWKLWEGGPLVSYFNSIGITHPDDMSGIILTSFWRVLNGVPVLLDDQVQKYLDFWKSQEKR